LIFQNYFNDKVVLVTGASRGIGKDIAIEFAELGAKVAINYNKSFDSAKEVYDHIKKINENVVLIKADVSRSAEVEEMISSVNRDFGDISILINNAGIAVWSSFLEITEEEFDRIISVDLKGAFLCSREAAKGMVKKKYGKIINISSTFGQMAQLNLTHYCVAKAGVVMLTKAMAYELGKYNINVNCIGPSTIVTDQNKEFTSREEVRKKEEAVHPLGRIGETKDIVNLTMFLASDYSSWITGQFIMVDGGLSCRTPQEPYPR
jgi:NAD(P)-dependent dehydrogenase (short-subunit alcohol dehydrogenase family)